MKKLAFIGNARAAVPYFLAVAAFVAVIGRAVVASSTFRVASAGDARHVAPASPVVGTGSMSVPAKPRKLETGRLDGGSAEPTWQKPRGDAGIVQGAGTGRR